MSEISFVYFDVGGVIFSFDAVFESMALRTSTSVEEVKKLFKIYDDEACKGNISTEDLLDSYKKHLFFEPPLNNFFEFWVSSFRPNKGVQDLMLNLSSKYSIGLFTNIYKGVYESIYTKGVIPKLTYASVIKSCDYGIVKPDLEIYKIAEEESNTSGSRILFIDDNPTYNETANKLGWKTVLFDTNNADRSIATIKRSLGM